MNAPYLFDVALSHVGYDALTAQRLLERLRPQFRLPIFAPGEQTGDGVDGEHAAAGARVLRHQARVVVVLHQRLWGDTPATRAARLAIEQRVAEHGSAFLVVIALDPDAERPPWMARRALQENVSPDGIGAAVRAIAAAVRHAGGTLRGETADESATRAEREERLAQTQDAVRNSSKAVVAVRREVEAMLGKIAHRVSEIRTLLPDADLRMRRTPERCVVQAGRVGLSVSWLPPRSDAPGHGTLLVIEWDGTVTLHGEPQQRNRQATPLREHVLHLDGGASPAWRWCSEDDSMRTYTSEDLAAQCVHLLMQRLRAPAAG
jgi:hypothetical protein